MLFSLFISFIILLIAYLIILFIDWSFIEFKSVEKRNKAIYWLTMIIFSTISFSFGISIQLIFFN